MKKIFCFLSLSALLWACDSGDDNTPYDPNAIQNTTLLKKLVETDDDNIMTTTDFHYDGYKINNITDSHNGSAVFTYAGNLITKIEYYSGETLTRTDLFTYNAAFKVSGHQALLHAEDYGTREAYTHNADGTVSYASFFGTVAQQNSPDLNGKIFFNNSGEVSRRETYLGSSVVSQETYEYDTWNHPLKNVIGLNEVLIYKGDTDGIRRNLLSTALTTNPRAITYQYSELSRFPVSSVSTSALDGGISTQYYYE
ncbi:hypothetical protein [Flavobacterium sp.]|uniref:hypothetical protein n=1 Tax=Flavobacterium sp. TaxID=239 RepID=UPI0039E2DB48